MRDDQRYFWGGFLAAMLGSFALLMDHFIYNADLLEPASTPHSLCFPAGVIFLLAGGAGLVFSFARG